MAFRAPPRMLRKVLGFKSMVHKDGKFYLWGVPCSIVPLFSFSYIQKLLEKKYGKKDAATVMYSLGVLQTKVGYDLISDRFGYAKTYRNKVELLKFITEQAAIVGNGLYKWIRIDLKNKIFIVRSVCPHGEHYKKLFRLQKEPTDHFIRGECATMVKKAFNIKNSFCIENRCVAKGDKYCEFVVKPIENFDAKDPFIKKQLIDRVLTLEECGAKVKDLTFG